METRRPSCLPPLLPSPCLRVSVSPCLLVFLSSCLLLYAACSPAGKEPAEAARGSILSVAAAADLKFALDEIVATFQEKHPDIQVRVTYGASGIFFAQLNNHAPFDIFF